MILQNINIELHKKQYTTNEPFSYTIIDNLINPNYLQNVSNDMDGFQNWIKLGKAAVDRKINKVYRTGFSHEEKYNDTFVQTGNRYVAEYKSITNTCWDLVKELNSNLFISWLEEITSISGLQSDPSMTGGGFQRTDNGGFLNIHLDFNWNEKLNLEPVVNLILFVNMDWKKEYGGALELWDNNNGRVHIDPYFNRMVIRENSDRSYHGFPTPINLPNNIFRKNLVLFYYKPTIPSNKRVSGHFINT